MFFVTAYHPEGFKEYGHRLIETFKAHNPSGAKMVVYVSELERGKEIYAPLFDDPETFIVRQQEDIPGFKEFIERWRGVPVVAGILGGPSYKGEIERKAFHIAQERAKEKEVRAGYSYRFDALKFFRMVLVMWDAGQLGSDDMVWLDGDNVVTADIPEDLVERVIKDDAGYAYLGRAGKHSETGFLIFRLPVARPLLCEWAGYYLHSTVFSYPEWHSAYMFDRAREACDDIKGLNITPGGRGHVIHSCWLGRIFDHCKGNRKKAGRSPEAKR